MAGLLAAALAALPISAGAEAQARTWPPAPYPPNASVRSARAFAEAAPGTAAFAVDGAAGGVRGLDQDLQFSSASVSKALLIAAELRRLRDQREPLDGGTRSLLESMIDFSDNDAASTIYSRVGDAGMAEVAERAGMGSFEATPGFWGGAQVTAGDLATFFYGLDRNLVGPHAAYAKRLFAEITSTQRWGIPAATPSSWRVYFKGGWRPPATEETSGPVTHQAALLVHRSGVRFGMAILTDQSPGSSSYATLEGITSRLLSDPPAPGRWPAN